MKKPIVLIIAGALASIATQSADGWMVTEHAGVTGTLDNQSPSIRYLVHVELRGPGPFEGLDGWVAARLDVMPSQPRAITTIEIRSLTHPDHMPSSGDVPADRTHEDVFIDAWLACSGDPCAEDYEVTVKRDPTLDLAPLTITGSIDAHAGGPSNQPDVPPGTEVVVSVMGPTP